MKRIVFLLLVLTGYVCPVVAQDDSLIQQIPPPAEIPADTDTALPKPVKKPAPVIKKVKADTLAPAAVADSAATPVKKDSVAAVVSNPGNAYGDFASAYIAGHPWLATGSDTISMPSTRYDPQDKDWLFYGICGIVFFLGILRIGFPKYFQDVFVLFWRSAFRQKQIRDQLQQAGMTTLLFNIFFVCSAAVFLYLLVYYINGTVSEPWLLFLICFVGIAVLYICKYFILKLAGWMFGQEEITNGYIFIVFLINKVMGVLLIPFILILAFSDAGIKQVAFTVSVILVIFLLLYRFILSFTSLRNELKISGLHLLLYVCGFEIIPVLVIYKGLLQLFERSS
ncbi:MAG: DUF4271 domain-containing protein [Chitinophagaceae bacterium]|nr:DUF4271 domain-containing protein [Chitinophagaceae bacterium]